MVESQLLSPESLELEDSEERVYSVHSDSATEEQSSQNEPQALQGAEELLKVELDDDEEESLLSLSTQSEQEQSDSDDEEESQHFLALERLFADDFYK